MLKRPAAPARNALNLTTEYTELTEKTIRVFRVFRVFPSAIRLCSRFPIDSRGLYPGMPCRFSTIRSILSQHMRAVYFLLGWSFFGLGAVGTVVPGLPTTPFMLLALWAFSKSSKRFHDWLYTHRLFGPPLNQWREHRVIPVKAKILSIATMMASFTYLALFTGMNPLLKLVVALVMLYGAAFILRQSSRVAEDETNTL